MLKKIDFRFVLGAVACFTLSYKLVMGETGIIFPDPIHEIVLFGVTSLSGIICLALIKK